MTDYEHLWRRAAIESLLQKPVLDYYDLELFKWFVGISNASIEEMNSEAAAETRRQVEAGDDCVGDAFIPADYFLRSLRYAQVVQLVSLVEHFLRLACERLTLIDKNRIIFKVEDLAGNKIQKQRKFLERFGGFQIDDERWKIVDDLIRVRNVIVHDFGRPNNWAVINNIRLENGELIIEDAFIANAISSLDRLFTDIESGIKEYGNRFLKPLKAAPTFPETDIDSVAGSLKRPGRALTLKEMDEAIAREAKRRARD